MGSQVKCALLRLAPNCWQCIPQNASRQGLPESYPQDGVWPCSCYAWRDSDRLRKDREDQCSRQENNCWHQAIPLGGWPFNPYRSSPPLENVLQIDAEKLYRREQSRMEGRRGIQGLINYVAAMEGARTYIEGFVDVSKLKGKAKKEAIAGSMVVQTPYLQLDVSNVLLQLVHVSYFTLLFYILTNSIYAIGDR